MKGEEIIRYFERHPASGITIHQLSTKIAKSYGWTYQHAKSLSEAGIIALRRVGPSLVCTIRAKNELSIGALCWASAGRAEDFFKDNPAARATAANINRHIGQAVSLSISDGKYTVLSMEGRGRHVIDGHEITFVQPTRENLAALSQGVILSGYERFWRLWGELNE